MLRNYLKIALRVFRKDNTFTLINVAGLATGMAVALLIVQYVRYELSYETSYPLSDRLVRLTIDYLNGGTVDAQDAGAYPPIGPKAKRELSEVVNYTRAYSVRGPNTTVQIGNSYHVIPNVYAVDSSFFSMFNYPLLRGGKTGLFTSPRQAVLTKKMALTYFHTLDVVGKTLKIPQGDRRVLLEIVGVVPDSPVNTHLKVDMLVSYPTMQSDFGEREDNWDNNNPFLYVQLAENVDYDRFTHSLSALSDRILAQKLLTNERVIGQKIGDVHLYSHKTYESEPNGEARSVYLLLGVAVLVLLSALVNYVNLTTARALDRAREVGMRKVVGSTQGQIKAQIFVETLLINLLAGSLAVGMVAGLRSMFVQVAGLPDTFAIFGDAFFWQSTGAFLVLSILLSGLYPAFVLSSFDPITVLKGSFAHSAKGTLLRKSLVVLQFAITLVLLVQTLVVYRQVHFLRTRNLGLKLDRTLVVRAPVSRQTPQEYGAFRQMLLSQSSVKSVSLSGTVPGLGSMQMASSTGINLSDAVKRTTYNYYLTRIDTAFISQMGIRLLAGRNFDATTRSGFSDTTNRQLIINQEVLRLWGIPTPEQAIGRRVGLWGSQGVIRGVVSNYHYDSPKSPYSPIIHMYSPNFDAYASVKFASGTADEQLALLKKVYNANFPQSPFSYFFMDSEYDKQYKADERFQQVFSVLTGIAILISCLGLFGLATFTVAKRTKEIGIRKVIGASTTNLLLLLTRDFLGTVALSVLLGLPLTYVLVTRWLADYATHIDLTWWLFAGPSLFVLLLVLLSIGSKTLATALMNPVKSLRSE